MDLSEAVTDSSIVGDEYFERNILSYVDDAIHGQNVVLLVKLVVWLDGYYYQMVGSYNQCGLSLWLNYNRLGDPYFVGRPSIIFRIFFITW